MSDEPLRDRKLPRPLGPLREVGAIARALQYLDGARPSGEFPAARRPVPPAERADDPPGEPSPSGE